VLLVVVLLLVVVVVVLLVRKVMGHWTSLHPEIE